MYPRSAEELAAAQSVSTTPDNLSSADVEMDESSEFEKPILNAPSAPRNSTSQGLMSFVPGVNPPILSRFVRSFRFCGC